MTTHGQEAGIHHSCVPELYKIYMILVISSSPRSRAHQNCSETGKDERFFRVSQLLIYWYLAKTSAY